VTPFHPPPNHLEWSTFIQNFVNHVEPVLTTSGCNSGACHGKDSPVSPAEIAAMVYHGLGISLDTELPGPQGRPRPIIEPISELF
jgi:hypothetical protein